MLHRPFGAVLCCLLAFGAAKAQSPFISYAERGEFALAAFGGLDTGLYGYANPALLSYVEGLEQGVAWSDSSSTYSWGLFTAAPRLGFGVGKRPPRPRVPSWTQHRRPRLQPRSEHGMGKRAARSSSGEFGGPARVSP